MILVALPGAGETAVAAYGVVANFGTIILNTLNGVSQTMQPLISINDGRRQEPPACAPSCAPACSRPSA